MVLTNEFPIGLLQGGWPKAYLKGIFVILPFRSNLTQLGYHRVLEEKQAEEEERIKEAASWPQLRGNSSKVLRSSEWKEESPVFLFLLSASTAKS